MTQAEDFRWKFVSCAIIVLGSAFFLHLWTISTTDQILLYDAGVATDTGHVQLIIPLSRLTSVAGRPESSWRKGIRGKTDWLDPKTGDVFKVPLGAWIAKPYSSTGCRSQRLLGFGYWTGPELSFARKGPFIVLFAPIYAVAILALATALFAIRKIKRFSLRNLLLTPLAFGLLITLYSWLLHLRIPL